MPGYSGISGEDDWPVILFGAAKVPFDGWLACRGAGVGLSRGCDFGFGAVGLHVLVSDSSAFSSERGGP